MKITFLLFISILYFVSNANAQKISSEKEKNGALASRKKIHTDTISNTSSQIMVSQNGGENTIMIEHRGTEKENSLLNNYTEVYEDGTNKVVISTYINPDSLKENNAGVRQSRMNSRATVIQRGKGNSVSISQSPLKIE